MDIIHGIRELCRGENGFQDMFNEAKSRGKLSTLTGGDSEAELFEALLYGSARDTIVEMINDAYNFKQYAVKAHGLLVSDGLDAADAKRAIEIFFKAFGFPGYREMDQSKVSTVSIPLAKTLRQNTRAKCSAVRNTALVPEPAIQTANGVATMNVCGLTA